VHIPHGAAVGATTTAAAAAAATTTCNATLKQQLANYRTPVVTSNRMNELNE
jgi:phospholipase/lecithinase/hemolysin